MARRPNYNFEKRQKEISKQKKKEEKEEKKRLKKEAIARGEIPEDDDIAWDEAFTGVEDEDAEDDETGAA